MFGPEYARACGIAALEPLGVFLPGDKNYPGDAHICAMLGFVDLQGSCRLALRHS